MKFSKAKCKVLLLGHCNCRHTNRLGREMIESSPAKKDLRVTGDEKLHEPAVCAHSSETQSSPGLHHKERGQQVKGFRLSAHMRSHLEYCAQL